MGGFSILWGGSENLLGTMFGRDGEMNLKVEGRRNTEKYLNSRHPRIGHY